MAFDPINLTGDNKMAAEQAGAPLGGTRSERLQRLQIGFLGIGAMILLVGLANIIMNSAKESQAASVPDAIPTMAAPETPAPARDPLADAGVVPDLPVEQTPQPTENIAPPDFESAPPPPAQP
tara:strand:- start:223 stop:591 length:369 start_codon:yes stop_codon:yes gene_type:complete